MALSDDVTAIHICLDPEEAERVQRKWDSWGKGVRLVILDSRPYEEYHRMNIPGGIDAPGAELVYRVHDLAADPDTLVVVNCAGRTRSIIGAQSLINAGIPNKVVALKNGTMGWHLAGLELERGQTRAAAAPDGDALIKANKRFDMFIMPGQRHGYGPMNDYFFWLRAESSMKTTMAIMTAGRNIAPAPAPPPPGVGAGAVVI